MGLKENAIEADLVGHKLAVKKLNDQKMHLEWRIKRLRDALVDVGKGMGAYSLDQLKHADNTIESMKLIAHLALEHDDETVDLQRENEDL